MIDRLEFLNQYGLGVGNVTESDGALLEIPICYLTIYELVDKFTDGFLRIVR